jgi:hypothetical protein
METYTVEIYRAHDYVPASGIGSVVETLPGTIIQSVTLTEAAKILSDMRSAGVQGVNSPCNQVSIVFFRNGKRVGWLNKQGFETFTSGASLKKALVKPDTFGYNPIDNVL